MRVRLPSVRWPKACPPAQGGRGVLQARRGAMPEVLVLAVHQAHADAWTAAGCRASRYQPRELLARDFDAVVTEIQRGRFRVLWVDVCAAERFVGSKSKSQKVWGRLAVLVRQCRLAGMAIALAATRASCFAEEHVVQLCTDN